MKRIERETVFENPRLTNELRVLVAYEQGLTLGELLVVLCGTNIRKHYMHPNTVKQTQKDLLKRKPKHYQLLEIDGKPVIPVDEVRLSKDLALFLQFGLVGKDEGGIYHLKHLYAGSFLSYNAIKHIAKTCQDRTILETDGAAYLSRDKNIHIFNINPQFNSIIQMNKKYQRRMDRITVKLKDALLDMDRLRRDILQEHGDIIGYGFIKPPEIGLMGDTNKRKSNFTVVMYTYRNMIDEYLDL